MSEVQETRNLSREVGRSLAHANFLPIIVPLVALILPRILPLCSLQFHFWPSPSIEVVLSVVKISSILGLAGHATMVRKPDVPPLTEWLYAFTPAYMVLVSLLLVFQLLPFCSWGHSWSTSCFIMQNNPVTFWVIAIFSFGYMGFFTVANLHAMAPQETWVTSIEKKKVAKDFAEFFVYMVNIPTLLAFGSILIVGSMCQWLGLAADGPKIRVALEAAITLITFVATNAAICVDIYARYRLAHHLRHTAPLEDYPAFRKLLNEGKPFILLGVVAAIVVVLTKLLGRPSDRHARRDYPAN